MTEAQTPTDDRSVSGPASPDQLDRMLVLVPLRLWVALVALVLLVALVVVWGFTGTVRDSVTARGMLERGGGLTRLRATEAGEVSSVIVRQGAQVRTGDPLVEVRAAGGEQSTVKAPSDGVVVDVAVDEGDRVEIGASLLELEPTTGRLHAIVAVPVDERADLRAGQEVEVQLSGALEPDLGYVVGTVGSIAPYPASDADLARAFGSDSLVRALTGGDAAYLVTIRLRRDPATASGLEWSSRSGARTQVAGGQTVRARIVVSDRSPVEEVFG